MNLGNISKKDYTLNDIADMTGTTIRTLRLDIKNGLLCGNKVDGKWSFPEEEIERYFNLEVIRQRIRNKVQAPAYTFMDALGCSKPSSCFIYDVYDKDEAETLNNRFAEYAKNRDDNNMCYTYFYDDEKHCGRFVFIGTASYVRGAMDILT